MRSVLLFLSHVRGVALGRTMSVGQLVVPPRWSTVEYVEILNELAWILDLWFPYDESK